jgi:hypothetical protein
MYRFINLEHYECKNRIQCSCSCGLNTLTHSSEGVNCFKCGRIEHIFKFGVDIDQGEISQFNLRGSTIANQAKATQSDNLVPFRKCRVRIIRVRYYKMHKIAP